MNKQNDFEIIFKKVKKDLDYYSKTASKILGCDYDDVYQELSIHIFNVKDTYIKTKSSIRTYFKNIIYIHFLQMLKKGRTKKIIFIKNIISLDEEKKFEGLVYSLHNFIPDKRSNFEKKFEVNDILDEIENNLSGRSKVIFQMMRYERMKKKEIAEILNITKAAVSNIVSKKIRPVVKKLVNFV